MRSIRALRALNKYIWKYKVLLLLGLLFVIISNVFGVYPPQVMREAIDFVGEQRQLNHLHQGFEVKQAYGSYIGLSLVFFGLAILALALIRAFFVFLTRQTIIVMSRKVENDLRNDLYDHYQQLSLSFYRKNKTGDLMARITEDVSRVRMYLGPGIMYTVNTLSLAVVVISTMLVVNAELTLYTILPLPILSYMIYRVESIVLRRSDRIQRQLSKLTAYTQEIFSGMRITKAFVREKEFSEKFADESDAYKERSMGLIKVNSLFQPSVMLLVGLSTLLTIFIGSRKVIQGELTIGNIAEFIIYVNMLTWPIIAIGWVSTVIQRAAASQERLNELMKVKPEIKFPKTGPEINTAALSVKEVEFTYKDTGIKALEEVSFTLKPGMKMGIIGPTGSGKTTLCHLLPRLMEPASGEIHLDGEILSAYSKDKLRQSIAYAPQDVFLFSDTIANNIAFGVPGASREQVEAAAKLAGIYDNIAAFPKGFDTKVGERGVTLSGGQKQRTALARAIIRNPKLLILDDSLSAVDTQTEETILSNLREMREQHQKMSMIMVSHRISTIQDADFIIVLEEGKITERGTHAELLARKGYYTQIFQKQHEEE